MKSTACAGCGFEEAGWRWGADCPACGCTSTIFRTLSNRLWAPIKALKKMKKA